jgi:hypothetical protein
MPERFAQAALYRVALDGAANLLRDHETETRAGDVGVTTNV